MRVLSRDPTPGDAEIIRRCLSYGPETGRLVWIARPHAAFPGALGREAGWSSLGYRKVMIDGTVYFLHRLAWWLSHGCMPADGIEIDHINGDRSDNRLANLRLATRAQNSCNQNPQTGGTSRFKGVSRHRAAGKWQAHIQVGRRSEYLGLFETEHEAASAYNAAAAARHGEFARVNA